MIPFSAVYDFAIQIFAAVGQSKKTEFLAGKLGSVRGSDQAVLGKETARRASVGRRSMTQGKSWLEMYCRLQSQRDEGDAYFCVGRRQLVGYGHRDPKTGQDPRSWPFIMFRIHRTYLRLAVE